MTPIQLTRCEAEALAHLVAGKSNKEIAACMGVSYEPARDYMRNLRNRFGVDNRTAVVSAAFRAGAVA